MKKTVLSLVVLTTLFSGKLCAQQVKIGYFDEKPILSLMPGIQKIDSLLDVFSKDSLQVEYDYNMSEFQRKENVLKADSTAANKMSTGQKEMILRDRNMLGYKLANWQAYTQNRLQEKQQKLLEPFMQKISSAFQKVIIEGKYTYVLRAEGLYYAPPGDNLFLPVCKKLGITVPKEYFGQTTTDNKPVR